MTRAVALVSMLTTLALASGAQALDIFTCNDDGFTSVDTRVHYEQIVREGRQVTASPAVDHRSSPGGPVSIRIPASLGLGY